MILRPDYVNAIKPYIDAPLVKILSGVRRCGKSTILMMIGLKIRRYMKKLKNYNCSR